MSISAIKSTIRMLPVVGPFLGWINKAIQVRRFPGTQAYWENRYSAGGDSGQGSGGQLLSYKADLFNSTFVELNVKECLELGCGDGRLASRLDVDDYCGMDISPTAVTLARNANADDTRKRFCTVADLDRSKLFECVLSADVIFHIIEENLFNDYMTDLFALSKRCVLIYANDVEIPTRMTGHMRAWPITKWVAENEKSWGLVEMKKNAFPYEGDESTGSISDLYVYEKR